MGQTQAKHIIMTTDHKNGRTDGRMISAHQFQMERGDTLVTRIDVYETCPQQMLGHKGGKIKNMGGECRDVTPTFDKI